jgi:hypothetical protein
MVGCIETMLPGRQPAWSDSRFNTPLYLLKPIDQLAAQGQPSYERLVALFRQELARAIRAHAADVNAHIARFPPEQFPDPFLSAFTRDCIARARDINDGGAQFPRLHGIAVMGLATLADSLAAVKELVFEEGRCRFAIWWQRWKSDFAGAEPLRQALANQRPQVRQRRPYVDEIAAQMVQWTSEECLKHTVPGGGRFVSAMAANVQNISAGREVGATPDGRRAFTPLSDAASPYFRPRPARPDRLPALGGRPRLSQGADRQRHQYALRPRSFPAMKKAPGAFWPSRATLSPRASPSCSLISRKMSAAGSPPGAGEIPQPGGAGQRLFGPLCRAVPEVQETSCAAGLAARGQVNANQNDYSTNDFQQTRNFF